jgi:hypothetical protein
MSKNITVVVNVLSAAVITELLMIQVCDDTLLCIYLLTGSVPARGLQKIKHICQVCLMGTLNYLHIITKT